MFIEAYVPHYSALNALAEQVLEYRNANSSLDGNSFTLNFRPSDHLSAKSALTFPNYLKDFPGLNWSGVWEGGRQNPSGSATGMSK